MAKLRSVVDDPQQEDPSMQQPPPFDTGAPQGGDLFSPGPADSSPFDPGPAPTSGYEPVGGEQPFSPEPTPTFKPQTQQGYSGVDNPAAPRPGPTEPNQPVAKIDPSLGYPQSTGQKETTDFSDVAGFVQNAGNVPQMNPSVKNDPNYWVKRINETGGLTAANWQYWWGRMLEPEGTHQEGGAAPANTYKPTSQAPSIFPGPTQQVGSDPFSLALTDKLKELIANNGQVHNPTSDALSASLAGILGNNGKPDPADLAMRMESARQPVDAAHKAQMSTLSAELADRGLLGAPGTPSGAEGGSVGQLEANLAPAYASAAQGASVAAGDQANQRLISAMSVAGQMSSSQAATLLGAISAGTDRQQMLANIAAKSLDQNIAWNEFLANYGLQRDQVMYMIQNNQLGALMPIIKAFIDQSGNANQGFV